MTKSKRRNTLATGLKAAMVKESPAAPPPAAGKTRSSEMEQNMVGGHFEPIVRRTLMLIQAETGKKLRELLGEAINDLCAKYGKPQPYGGE